MSYDTAQNTDTHLCGPCAVVCDVQPLDGTASQFLDYNGCGGSYSLLDEFGPEFGTPHLVEEEF